MHLEIAWVKLSLVERISLLIFFLLGMVLSYLDFTNCPFFILEIEYLYLVIEVIFLSVVATMHYEHPTENCSRMIDSLLVLHFPIA
jgi:hypothetical protein